MCLWLLTACIGLLPSNPQPSNVVVVQAAPPSILSPLPASTTVATTTLASSSLPSMPPSGNTPGMLPRPTNQPTTLLTTPNQPLPSMPPLSVTTNSITTASPLTTNPTAVTGAVSYLILCNNPDAVCVLNNSLYNAGPPMIDPRLGTTPGPYMQSGIIGYNALPVDDRVKFPVSKRSLDRKIRRYKRQSCSCVPAGTCPSVPAGIDFRIVTPTVTACPAGQVYCCYSGGGQTTISCGVLQTVPTTNIVVLPGQANFGEYPWMAVILSSQNDYIAGGTLIDQYNVLTVTHRIQPYIVAGTAPNTKVRLGDWNLSGTSEPVSYQEYTVLRVFTHPSYNPSTLQYDITLLRLSRPVPFTPAVGSAPTINRACLPSSNTATYTGQRCWVSGWGKNNFTAQGQYQQILKKVDVPIVDPTICESQLRTARLGSTWTLDRTSFICAGGEASKDSCTGDGGSGLVCQVNGLWTVVGLVAWGLGCASPTVPGVYLNIPALLPWIQQQVATI